MPKEHVRKAIIPLLKRETIRKIADKLHVNREKLRENLWYWYPNIMRKKHDTRLVMHLLDTRERGEMVMEIKGKRWVIDKRYYHVIKSLSCRDNGNGYLQFSIGRKSYYFHRLITDAPTGSDVDHANGKKYDNRRKNLRVCTRSQNAANARTSGVSYDNRPSLKKRYTARISGRHIARFETRQEAENCYKNVHILLYGEFSYFNRSPADA